MKYLSSVLLIIIPKCRYYAIGNFRDKPSSVERRFFVLSKVLFDTQPIVVDRTLAKIIGLNEAIILQQIHYWLKINETKKQNFHDGRYWTYNSIGEWHKNDFSFWSEKTVARAFSKLEDLHIFIIGNYNSDRRDRTKWYSIDYEILEGLISDRMQKDKMTECKQANCPNANTQNGIMHVPILTEPLPEITTETTTETNQSDLIEFDSIDSLILYYVEKYKLPYERILSVYDRIIPQYKAGNVKKFTPYFEAALEQEKIDYERNKFID